MSENDDKSILPSAEPDDEGALMYVRCSVCGEWLDVKPGKLHWVSHGLCPDCHASEMARILQFLEERRKRRGQAGPGVVGSPEPGADPAV